MKEDCLLEYKNRPQPINTILNIIPDRADIPGLKQEFGKPWQY
jgi:hypothetical protein